jgi:hypothetical protein
MSVVQAPDNLRVDKKRRLAAARKLFIEGGLDRATPDLAFDDRTCINYSGSAPFICFQASESFRPNGAEITALSPEKKILEAIQSIFTELQIGHTSEFTRTFSPEETLLGVYLAVASGCDTSLMFRQKHLLSAWKQALDEAVEGRHTHAIRAVGIGTEELIVSIFETLARDRAPAGPLGQLLQLLDTRVAFLTGKGEAAPQDMDLSELKRLTVDLIRLEKAKSDPNETLVRYLNQTQKVLIPAVVGATKHIAAMQQRFPEEIKYRLFPKNVQRSLEELVSLRNRVSHRSERGKAISDIEHIDTAMALRAFAIVANWWETERACLDYSASPHSILTSITERSRKLDEEAVRGV